MEFLLLFCGTQKFIAACQGGVICNREVLYWIILQKPKFLHAFRSLIRDRDILVYLYSAGCWSS